MREDADSLSMAFLLLLARLSPVERAVFLLHEVFDYGYDEISPIIGKSEDNCRQLAVRARRHVNEHKPRFEASRQQRDRLADQFFDAVEDGDMNGLIELLAADVVVYGDGGGHSPSWRRPRSGRPADVRDDARHRRWPGADDPVNHQPGQAPPPPAARGYPQHAPSAEAAAQHPRAFRIEGYAAPPPRNAACSSLATVRSNGCLFATQRTHLRAHSPAGGR